MSVVYTCFAGRRENLEVQFKYIDHLIEKGLIDQVHLWNYTREIKDSVWLKHAFNTHEPLVYRAAKREYRKLPLKSHLAHLETRIRGKHDAHFLLIKDNNTLYEIVIGGWNNKRCVVRNNSGELCQYVSDSILIQDDWTRVSITYNRGHLEVRVQGECIMKTEIAPADYQVMISATQLHSIDFDLEPMQHLLDIDKVAVLANKAKYQVMECPNKYTWIDYYEHYTFNKYPNHVIIKSDDDIVYLDVDGFKQFIQNRINNPDPIMWFPSIINNGVCSYYQQKMGLIPESVGSFPYDTFEGELWSNANLCNDLHMYFINNHKAICNTSRNTPIVPHPIGDRISINFFAILSKDLSIYQDLVRLTTPHGLDDEFHLSITMAKEKRRRHVVDPSMIVAHLSFYRQVEKGLDVNKLMNKYRMIDIEV